MLATDREPRFRDLQHLADRIKWTIENQLHEQFTTFDVIEDMTPSFQDEEQVYYRLRIRTDDDGSLVVKAIQPENGSDWAVHIEEYNRGNNLTQDAKGFEQPMNLKRMGDRLKWEVENQVQRTFRIFDVVESDLKIDGDGYVKVNISQEHSGSEWLVRVKEFDRGNEAMEENEKFSEKEPCGQTESIETDMQDMADMVKREVENQVHKDFKVFKAVENELRIRIDSHEDVIVKVTRRGGGMDWLVEVETFDRENRCFEGNKESRHQKTVVH